VPPAPLLSATRGYSCMAVDQAAIVQRISAAGTSRLFNGFVALRNSCDTHWPGLVDNRPSAGEYRFGPTRGEQVEGYQGWVPLWRFAICGTWRADQCARLPLQGVSAFAWRGVQCPSANALECCYDDRCAGTSQLFPSSCSRLLHSLRDFVVQRAGERRCDRLDVRQLGYARRFPTY
jgi:hypothetical protein